VPDADTMLAVYLNDHLAGATVGRELAARTLGSNRGTDLEPVLEHLLREIEEDREALRDVMRRVGAGKDLVKQLGAWAGEKVGRAKLNGSLLSYSPLSRLVELEALALGVDGKLSMWRNLRAIAPGDPRLDGVELDRLIDRAVAQSETLAAERLRAAQAAFGAPAAAAP
jgi:hypothetical protein